MSKEYLDRKEVEKIIKNMLEMIATSFNSENSEIMSNLAMNIWEENEKDFNIFINKLCQLKPKNQKVIAEKLIKKLYPIWFDTVAKFVSYIEVGKEEFFEKTIEDDVRKIVKIILEEE